jgi:hypothetical protein
VNTVLNTYHALREYEDAYNKADAAYTVADRERLFAKADAILRTLPPHVRRAADGWVHQ